MDRTDEFRNLLGSRTAVSDLSGLRSPEVSDGDHGGRSGFNAEAARIGQEIHLAQLKLDELGKRMFHIFILI